MSNNSQLNQEIVPEWFSQIVLESDYPCVMAKLAVKSKSIQSMDIPFKNYQKHIPTLYSNLIQFIKNTQENSYKSFLLSFSGLENPLSELEFESFLWSFLSEISKYDSADWATNVSSKPNDSEFSFSIGGKAFYIIGMHPNSSRLARRTPYPAMIFNLHDQFEKLRKTGKYRSIRNSIRQRDLKFQGSINPMVMDFGSDSEAKQYSGRRTGSDWQCPFRHS